jgi:hypothetical protein
MLKTIKWIWPAICLFVLGGCEKYFDHVGPQTSREILIEEPFGSLDISNIFDIVIVQDTISKVIVTCGEKQQDKVSIYVKDGALWLNHSAKQNWDEGYKHIQLELHTINAPHMVIHDPVYITNKDTLKFDQLYIYDLGDMAQTNLTIHTNFFLIDMSADNFGKHKIKGQSLSAYIKGKGSAFINADSLQIQNCQVVQQSIGDISVNVSNNLTISLEESGNVYYSGSPNVTIEKQTSSGKIIKR